MEASKNDIAGDYINGVIKAVVSRSTVDALREVLKRWGRLSPADLNGPHMKGTKTKVCSALQQIAKREHFTREIAGDLELAYMQINSSKKFWKVFKLKGNSLKNDLDSRSLKSRLVRSLQIRKTDGTVDGNMSLFAGIVWLRLHLHTVSRRRNSKQATQPYSHNNSVFLLTFPGSPIFIMSRTGVKNCSLVLKAITEVTDAERAVDTQLSGQHVASLADLALRTQKQPADKYRKAEEKENPLAARAVQKRKATDEQPDFEDTAHVVDETRPEKRRRREVLARVFGLGSQPLLEKIEYKFDVKHPGPDSNVGNFRAVIGIKGKSVLDGLCQLGKEGFIKFPLPRHLTSVVSLSQNSFSIKDKT